MLNEGIIKASPETKQVPETICSTEKHLGFLKQTASELEKRLDPLLRPAEPSEVRPIAEVRNSSLVQLAGTLQALDYEIEELNGYLTDILRRLEI
jgi:hypothetical protein